MQWRIAAVAAKKMPDIRTLSFASYQAKVVVDAEGASPALAFKNEPRGMWCRDHYLELLMGEAPRLTDTADGYGPKGKNFIVPGGAGRGYPCLEHLRAQYPDLVRPSRAS